MAGNIKVGAVQLGDSATATQNFTLRTNVDGTATLARGNVGATTQDILTIPTSGAATIVGARQLLQSVTYQTGAVATGTALIPQDDTIPQITEGNEYMSLAITPLHAASTLEVSVVVAAVSNSVITREQCALFRDSTANAIAVSSIHLPTATTSGAFAMTHTAPANSTATTTFRVRMGGRDAGTTTFNGEGGARLFGGALASSITIKEYAA